METTEVTVSELLDMSLDDKCRRIKHEEISI
jgi:hypothetical protein